MRDFGDEEAKRARPDEPARATLLARAEELMQSEPNFSRFLARAIEATDAGDLVGAEPAEMEAVLRRTYAGIDRPGDGPHRLVITPDALAGGGETLDIYSLDMPFITDSVVAALRGRGAAPRLIAHPVLAIDPQSHRLLDRQTPDAQSLSVLHLHLARLDEAARQDIRAALELVLKRVTAANTAWRPMLARLARAAENLTDDGPLEAETGEAVRFLGWLAEQNFTFLGMRDYRIEAGDDGDTLVPVLGGGLGILSDPDLLFLRQGGTMVEMTDSHRAFLAAPDPLLVTKSNLRSVVHRPVHMDYVGVKTYTAGIVTGELRILGLFTSAAQATPPREVPLLRHKLDLVIGHSGLGEDAHARKALEHALDTYPREELFQIEPARLAAFAGIIAGLADRPRLRLLVRPDPFGNFVSILMFMPRERYDSALRARIGALLADTFGGRLSAWYPFFPEADLVRVHFIIGRDGGPAPTPDMAALETAIADMLLSFGERLALIADDPGLVEGFEEAFGAGYRAEHTPEQALIDIALVRRLDPLVGRALRFSSTSAGRVGVTMASLGGPIPLSDRVPLLENFGFRVIDERTYPLHPASDDSIFLHDLALELPEGAAIDLDARAEALERALLAVWQHRCDNDGFGALTLVARLDWPDIAVLRALCRYLRQLGFPLTLDYLARTLAAHPDAAAGLVALFHTLHDPRPRPDRDERVAAARQAVEAALDRTRSLDEDRTIRRLLNLVEAAVRTNFFQQDEDGAPRPALAIKFDSQRVDAMPAPVPYREIFVSAPGVEGIHLRSAPVSRGGLRWSDRPEDFRTETLGLMKTQQVKNAIIVPAGAKGAFVSRNVAPEAGQPPREAANVEAAYRSFVGALLDVTDNLDGQRVVPPAQTLRRDGDDPYLVIAADRGTSGLSDLGNSIAAERGFWLGDAFASGGSAGYDHKRLGITARGAYDTVRRHFRELDRDIAATPISVIGIGDMSGDVFGNFMLLSPNLHLVAAFDHRDIFLDPVPDPERALAERRRLFALPRSSWQDYDRTRLSRGGDVFSRAQKSVTVSNEARRMLGLATHTLTPLALISAILRAEIDLLYFGGIGTFVRAGTETDLEIGDKANDAIRVTAGELRAKVVGEGANLAVTQRARIEYARAGGRINTDAIDNSAGVNCSDLEVNIKIALAPLVAAGRMDLPARQVLLERLQDEVVELCLRNNYLQSLALSLAERAGPHAFPDHVALLRALEARGDLDRLVDTLPGDLALGERQKAGEGFTRPELAVLLAHAKNALRADLAASPRLADPYLSRELQRYFPPRLADEWPDAITGHRLRPQIIATVLANAMLNHGGPALADGMARASSAEMGTVAAAFVLARDAFRLDELSRLVDMQDGHLNGGAQLALYAAIERLTTRTTLWMLRNVPLDGELGDLARHYADGLGEVRNLLPSLITGGLASASAARAVRLEDTGAPRDLARRIAELPDIALGADVVLLADRCGERVGEAARALFALVELFGLAPVLDAAEHVIPGDITERLAIDRAAANLRRGLRDLGYDVLATGEGSALQRVASWQAANRPAIERTSHAVAALTAGDMTLARLSLAAGLLSDLARTA